MNENNVIELKDPARANFDPLTALLREGAQKLIHQAVEAELQDCLALYTERKAENGHAGVVRSGYLPERLIQTGVGPVTVKIPKIRSKDGNPVTFQSALVPPYVRKTQSLEAAIPWLYLKGVSSGEMGDALKFLVAHRLRVCHPAQSLA
jgi:putative transposase